MSAGGSEGRGAGASHGAESHGAERTAPDARSPVATLYQFPFSHFCEKARWGLDHKGVPFRTRDLVPGLHVGPTRRVAPRTSVPILVDTHGVTQGSSEILDHLERHRPLPSLTPTDPDGAERARSWETRLDRDVGVALRLWFYHHTLQDRRLALGFLTSAASARERLVLRVLFPWLRAVMRRRMEIDEANAARALDTFRRALDDLEGEIADRPFLVGDAFSRADLTGCALLSPLIAPGRDPAELRYPRPVIALRDELSGRPSFAWVEATYRAHRRPG